MLGAVQSHHNMMPPCLKGAGRVCVITQGKYLPLVPRGVCGLGDMEVQSIHGSALSSPWGMDPLYPASPSQLLFAA